MNISANTVISTLFILAPQFYTNDELILAGYNTLYTMLLCQVNQSILVCCGAMAMALLMAAYLTLSQNPNLGVNAGMHEGQLSITYNVNAEIEFLNLSPYGRAYLDLIARTVYGGFVTNLPVQLGGVISNAPVGMGCCGNNGYGFGNAGWYG